MTRNRDLPEAAFRYYSRLGRVQKYVFDHYSERITLSDVAGVAGMERTSFSDFFHRKTGLRYRDWLAAVRISKAQELITARNLPLARVAREVGYASVRTFERAFLRVTGETAAEYKRAARPA